MRRREAWLVATVTGIAFKDSLRPLTARRQFGEQTYRVTTFKVDQSWTRDERYAEPVVRVLGEVVAPCPIPNWVLGVKYLVQAAPDSTGQLRAQGCTFAQVADDSTSQLAIKALGKPTWRRKRWYWPF